MMGPVAPVRAMASCKKAHLSFKFDRTRYNLGNSIILFFVTGLVIGCPKYAFADIELSDQEKRGKRIYVKGQGAEPISAFLSGPEIKVPANQFPCIQCHKEEGTGAREGGVLAPDITWGSLTLPDSSIRPSGRAHAAYNPSRLAAAIRDGVDPAGQELKPAMPRYIMQNQDMEDLIAYLQVVENEPVQGVTEDMIRVGLLKSSGPPLAAGGEGVERLLSAYFEEFNALGGVFGRKLQLVTFDLDFSLEGEAAFRLFEKRISDKPVFCFVGNVGLPHGHRILDYLSSEEIPVVAPVAILGKSSFASDRNTFFIHSSLFDQARVLVDYLAESEEGKKINIAILHASDPFGDGAAEGVRVQSKVYGFQVVSDEAFRPEAPRLAEAVENLKSSQPEAVFFFGSGGHARDFLLEADRQIWTPRLFGSAELAWSMLMSLPERLLKNVSMVSPAGSPDPGSKGMIIFSRLINKYEIPTQHASFLSTAFAGARLLDEGLRLSGRRLTRSKLVQEIGGFYRFETGVTPALSYNENRRTGSIGAAVFGVHPTEKKYTALRSWSEPK